MLWGHRHPLLTARDSPHAGALAILNKLHELTFLLSQLTVRALPCGNTHARPHTHATSAHGYHSCTCNSDRSGNLNGYQWVWLNKFWSTFIAEFSVAVQKRCELQDLVVEYARSGQCQLLFFFFLNKKIEEVYIHTPTAKININMGRINQPLMNIITNRRQNGAGNSRR